jgi:hypothetical protein
MASTGGRRNPCEPLLGQHMTAKDVTAARKTRASKRLRRVPMTVRLLDHITKPHASSA